MKLLLITIIKALLKVIMLTVLYFITNPNCMLVRAEKFDFKFLVSGLLISPPPLSPKEREATNTTE